MVGWTRQCATQPAVGDGEGPARYQLPARSLAARARPGPAFHWPGRGHNPVPSPRSRNPMPSPPSLLRRPLPALLAAVALAAASAADGPPAPPLPPTTPTAQVPAVDQNNPLP